jgi:hypothetical protein
MADVISLYGVCEGEPCKKAERRIVELDDLHVVNGKRYHKGCEPAAPAQNNSSA